MQLSQSIKKFIHALGQKKYRDEQKLFIAEGEKVIADIIGSGAIPKYVVYESSRNRTLHFPSATKQYECDAKEMQFISSMSTAPGVLAVFPQWGTDASVWEVENPRWLIADGIKDPGNMGTLIRTAHWFGAHAVVCINSCVELYNPKTVQSTMGSLGKIPVIHVVAEEFFSKFSGKTIFFGADLEGERLNSIEPQKTFALIIGSESHGLSEIAAKHVAKKIFIPEYDALNRPESLNAAVSAGIILSRIAAE
jgi:TrmH family RNA methyltransferase